MKKKILNAYMYDVLVDYRDFDTSNMMNIQKYLMENMI